MDLAVAGQGMLGRKLLVLGLVAVFASACSFFQVPSNPKPNAEGEVECGSGGWPLLDLAGAGARASATVVFVHAAATCEVGPDPVAWAAFFGLVGATLTYLTSTVVGTARIARCPDDEPKNAAKVKP